MTHPYFIELSAFDLPAGDWAVFGSGPLLLRGWIDQVSDLDVIARGEALERAIHLGEPQEFAGGGVLWRLGRHITVGDFWHYGNFDLDHLIDTAELIDDIPCVRLEHIVAYKRVADRPQDHAHLAAVEANS